MNNMRDWKTFINNLRIATNEDIDRLETRAKKLSAELAANAQAATPGVNGREDPTVLAERDARKKQEKDEWLAKKEAKKNEPAENPDDYIEFTYNPGDTFGQKILDLGIATNNGLWGDNGDVAYYTQQLIDGGYLDGNGNVKLGVPIRLKKRK